MDGGIFMTQKGVLCFEIISEFLGGRLSRKEASIFLEVTERSVARIARRVEAKGVLGAVHGSRGRQPWNKKNENEMRIVMGLVKERYFDFNMSHALEMLGNKHDVDVSYSTFRRWCHEKGFVKRRKRRKGIARQKRARMPNEGLLIQMDGSPHDWNGREKWCLISTIDDATSKVPYAEFFGTENTLGAMKVLRGLIERCGIPFALYVDKAHCFGGGNRTRYNQFRRACQELDIKVIPANSPEAKGRVERGFDTFQDRIIPELRLYGISKMDKANEYLRETFLPNYWDRQLTVEARNPESKYRHLPKHIDLEEIFCLKYQRLVNRDHTVNWDAKPWQLDWPRERPIRGHKIEFRVYPDGSWKAFHADDPVAVTPILKPIKVFQMKKKECSHDLVPHKTQIPTDTEFKGHNLRYTTV